MVDPKPEFQACGMRFEARICACWDSRIALVKAQGNVCGQMCPEGPKVEPVAMDKQNTQ